MPCKLYWTTSTKAAFSTPAAAAVIATWKQPRRTQRNPKKACQNQKQHRSCMKMLKLWMKSRKKPADPAKESKSNKCSIMFQFITLMCPQLIWKINVPHWMSVPCDFILFDSFDVLPSIILLLITLLACFVFTRAHCNNLDWFACSHFCSSEIVHVWKDERFSSEGPTHSAQMMIDGVNYLSETVCSISAQPSKALTEWVADWAAPSYWKANAEIIVSILTIIRLNLIAISNLYIPE